MPRSVTLSPICGVIAGFLAVCLGAAPALAQQKAAGSAAKTGSTTQVLRAEGDGFPIHITYYPANPDKNPNGVENAAVVVLLHGEGGSRLIWDKSSAPQGKLAFAPQLAELGYAVVSVDLRKHGESLGDGQSRALDNNDFVRMAQNDLPAVNRFLLEEHENKKLNINKMAIVASDAMGPVAMEFAKLDWEQRPYLDGPGGSPGTPRGQDVRALVLLSPEVSVGRVNGTRAANFLKNPGLGIAAMIIAGTRDADDKGSAQRLEQIFAAPRQNEGRVEFLRPNTNARGTDLLANPAAAVEPPILSFLDKHVRTLNSTWETRKSRYDREVAPE
ncbi:MAG: hypothetical protein JNG89_03480 [Planctomycetaceae bacterium]|nr:hypothetical protein [Planctomycetaceae bacterium]